MKYAYNDNNKQTFWKNCTKTLQTNITVNGLYDTKLCGSNSLVSYGSFTTMLVLSVFYLPKFLLSLVFAYSYISQISVETHSLCGVIYNNHIIANCV